MSLISESQALAADLYGIAGELGALEHTVTISVPVSTAQDPETGIVQRGEPTNTVLTTALVSRVGIERAMKSGGSLEEGDLVVSQVPRSDVNDPLVIRPDVAWLVSGPGLKGTETFRLIEATPELLQWVVKIRRGGA